MRSNSYRDGPVVRIKIGESERELDSADAQWVAEQVRGYERNHGSLPCVRVTVDEDRARITLITAECARSGGGGGGAPNWNAAESDVLESWRRLRLDGPSWTQGSLVAFIQRLRQLF